VQGFLHKPLKPKDKDVYCLLLVGLYQLLDLAIPPHAAVAETVEAARCLGKPWASGLVNAVLRGFERAGADLLAQIDQQEEAATAHPSWLLRRIQRDWPDDAPSILQANNQHPPMTLRVNARRMDRERYLRLVSESGIVARAAEHTSPGVTLNTPLDVSEVLGFDAGWVSVQDAAAQLTAPLLAVRSGERILDACAAPGGKACHILESAPCNLWAVDISSERLRQVEENLSRLGLQARLVAGDATEPTKWWDGVPFDRILVDAPCSSTGVIRRHPDIKMLRRPQDIPALTRLQGRLLEALWPLLRPGGCLVYCTCSILPEENEQVVQGFLAAHADASEQAIDAGWGHTRVVGRQVLPGEHQMDGFYYARVEKR
jgi:16S rRNA (cytosine967-C5)-methyltransferase